MYLSTYQPILETPSSTIHTEIQQKPSNPTPLSISPPFFDQTQTHLVKLSPRLYDSSSPRHGCADGYIDDLVDICLHINKNVSRTIRAILLVISKLVRPMSNHATVIPHQYILSRKRGLPKALKKNVK